MNRVDKSKLNAFLAGISSRPLSFNIIWAAYLYVSIFVILLQPISFDVNLVLPRTDHRFIARAY